MPGVGPNSGPNSRRDVMGRRGWRCPASDVGPCVVWEEPEVVRAQIPVLNLGRDVAGRGSLHRKIQMRFRNSCTEKNWISHAAVGCWSGDETCVGGFYLGVNCRWIFERG